MCVEHPNAYAIHSPLQTLRMADSDSGSFGHWLGAMTQLKVQNQFAAAVEAEINTPSVKNLSSIK
jgi:hypothetical protein